MQIKWNLSSSQADRINFDESVRRYADAMLEALTKEEALNQDPQRYAGIGWGNHELTLEHGDEEVDDIEEAEARFLDAFANAVRDWQRDRMTDDIMDELYNQEAGYTTAIEVFPAGQKDGLDYGPDLVEIVLLSEANYGPTVAYRLSTDAVDNDWEIGAVEDAVIEALQWRASVIAEEQYATIGAEFYASLENA